MTLTTSKPRRTGMAKACFFTAIVNGLFSSAYAQDSSAYAQDATRPGLPPPAGASPNLLHYGVFDVLPNLRGGASYDDNIYISSTNRQSDAILSVAPGVLLGAGDYRAKEESLVSIAYSPNFILYTDHTRNSARQAGPTDCSRLTSTIPAPSLMSAAASTAASTTRRRR